MTEYIYLMGQTQLQLILLAVEERSVRWVLQDRKAQKETKETKVTQVLLDHKVLKVRQVQQVLQDHKVLRA
jgi:hypothetical protein